ncbi:MAG: hypothetical protein IJF31_04075 [Clostridia bacterium]|nr:hypothetical protein [Clostridia bacterium]
MMKKIVSLCLIVCLLLSMTLVLTSCQNAQKTVDKAIEKTAELDSYAVQMNMNISMTGAGVTTTIPMTMKMKIADAKSDAPKAEVDMSMEMFGETMDAKYYTSGEWAYFVDGENSYKIKVADAGVDSNYSEDMMKKLPEELLKDVEVVKNDDKSKTVTVAIPDETFNELFDDLLDMMTDSMGVTATGLTISDAVVEITVKDGYVQAYGIDFSMAMTVEGVSFTATAECEMVFDNPGEAVTVTLPEGYESFREITNG